MPSTGPFTTTGESHLVLPAAHAVDRISVRLVTINPRQTRLIGTAFPRGIWHVGEGGLGSWPDDAIGANPAIHYYSRFLHSENEMWWVLPFAGTPINSGSVWWRWLPGVTVEMEAFW